MNASKYDTSGSLQKCVPSVFIISLWHSNIMHTGMHNCMMDASDELPGLHKFRSAHVGCTPTCGWYYIIMRCKNLFHMCCTLTSNIPHTGMRKYDECLRAWHLCSITVCNEMHEEDHVCLIKLWMPGWWALYSSNCIRSLHSDLHSRVHVARGCSKCVRRLHCTPSSTVAAIIEFGGSCLYVRMMNPSKHGISGWQ